jgi:FAD:protein FMN transferase
MAGVRRVVPTMGTVATIDVRDDAVGSVINRAIDAVAAELERLEQMFSTFRPSSEISRINDGALDLGRASPEVREVLAACAYLERDSGGVFRIHPPEHPAAIDPAGFVKGWASERAATRLTKAGLDNWCVNVGGDLLTRGRPEGDRGWRAAIEDPADAQRIVLVVDATDLAVATSGAAARGAHVWDGRSGARPELLASLTVVGPQLAWADAFATIGFAMGLPGIEWVGRHQDYHALAVGLDGSLVASPEFDSLIVAD